jgi:hypothetical protein
MDYTTDTYEVDYHAGLMVITDKLNDTAYMVQLRNRSGRNVTLSQFKSCIRSHGINQACSTFIKLAANQA